MAQIKANSKIADCTASENYKGQNAPIVVRHADANLEGVEIYDMLTHADLSILRNMTSTASVLRLKHREPAGTTVPASS